jgi:hypothetical protein
MGNKHLLRLIVFVMLAANTYQEISFTSTVASLQFRDVNTKLGLFTELFVEGHGYSNAVGSPKLPVYRRLIEIPSGASFDIVITKQEYDEYDCVASGIGFLVIPAQAPVSKAITDPSQIPFEFNAQAYQQNAFLGGPLVTVEYSGRMRAVTIARMDVAPVQYNPVTGKLRIYRTIEATVTFTGGDVAATLSMKNRLASPYFEKNYRMLANYKPGNDQLITSRRCSRSSSGKRAKASR